MKLSTDGLPELSERSEPAGNVGARTILQAGELLSSTGLTVLGNDFKCVSPT